MRPAIEVQSNSQRRGFVRLSSLIMGTGIVAGYGCFMSLIGRFLFPGPSKTRRWQFVSDIASIDSGESLLYESPAGESVVITRLAVDGSGEDFIALSGICPHLGCRVHWESQNDRFFCPCHNGAFDEQGAAIAGPPADAKQELSRYPLRVDNGLLFIEVETQPLV